MIYTKDFLSPLLAILKKCQGVWQNEKWHPEGDVFNHSLQVAYHAFRETTDTDLILAAMLHDVGKSHENHGHDKIAVEMLQPFLSVKSLWLIKQHMRIWTLLQGEMRKQNKVKELIGHPWLPELILLARWDKMGRNPHRHIEYNPDNILEKLNLCVEHHFEENQNLRQ